VQNRCASASRGEAAIANDCTTNVHPCVHSYALAVSACARRSVVISRLRLSRLAQVLPLTALASVSITPRQEARSRADRQNLRH
jgi:hypothetical protein